MADWRRLAKALALADGQIDERESKIIRRELLEDGVVDWEEIEFIIELRKAAQVVAPSLNQFLFQGLKKSILKDGVISAKETHWIRKCVSVDGKKMGDDEAKFLQDLKREAGKACPEFLELYYACFPAERPATPPVPRRDSHNADLRKFYEKLDLRGDLGECEACGLVAPIRVSGSAGQKALLAIQNSPQAVAAFFLVMKQVLGEENVSVPDNPALIALDAIFGDSYLAQFKLARCPGCNKLLCKVCVKAGSGLPGCALCAG